MNPGLDQNDGRWNRQQIKLWCQAVVRPEIFESLTFAYT